MNVYENHKDRRYKELDERKRKFIGKNKYIKNVKIKLCSIGME